jgi:hypothetical protein
VPPVGVIFVSDDVASIIDAASGMGALPPPMPPVPAPDPSGDADPEPHPIANGVRNRSQA